MPGMDSFDFKGTAVKKPVFVEGTAMDGRTATAADVRAMASNTNRLIREESFVPPANIGHKTMFDSEDILRGFVRKFSTRRIELKGGKKLALVADMFLSDELFNLHKTGKLPKVSVEIADDIFNNAGKNAGPAIVGVAFLGSSIPAVPQAFTLSNVVPGHYAVPKIVDIEPGAVNPAMVQQGIITGVSTRKARRWCKNNGYDYSKLVSSGTNHTAEQKPGSDFKVGTLRTIKLADGIFAITGEIQEFQMPNKEDAQAAIDTLQEIVDAMPEEGGEEPEDDLATDEDEDMKTEGKSEEFAALTKTVEDLKAMIAAKTEPKADDAKQTALNAQSQAWSDLHAAKKVSGDSDRTIFNAICKSESLKLAVSFFEGRKATNVPMGKVPFPKTDGVDSEKDAERIAFYRAHGHSDERIAKLIKITNARNAGGSTMYAPSRN